MDDLFASPPPLATDGIRVGIGGWTFAPWRKNFYPDGLVQRRELEYASRHVSAIEINGTGVAPPYTVLAIGDRGTLAADFVETASGLRFVALARQYGFEQKMVNADDLHLPAAPGALLRLPSATNLTDRGGGPGGKREGEAP